MANNSISVVVRNLTTGGGIGGLSITFRHSRDSFASDVYTASAIAGKTGCYEFTDVSARFLLKLFVGGVEDTSYGATKGRPNFDPEDSIVVDDDGNLDATSRKIVNLANASSGTDALNRQSADARYVAKSGSTMSGELNMGANVISNVADAVDGKDALNTDSADERYVQLTGGAMSGELDMDGNKIVDVGNATSDADALNRITADGRFVSKTANNSISGNNIHSGQNTFTGAVSFPVHLPQSNIDATGDTELTNLRTVSELIAGISITAFQNSVNRVRLMPGQTNEFAKVYNSYALAQDFCRTNGGFNRRYVIHVEGAGEGGTTIQATNGAIPGNSTFNSYVSLLGHRLIRLLVDDDSFSVAAGTVVLENLTIERDDDGSGTPNFTNFIFKDCYFNFDVQDLGFVSCVFAGTNIVKNTGGTISYTTCKPNGIILSNKPIPSGLVGYGEYGDSEI